MIVVSAAEFAATVVKSCLGVGVERGVAEEIGPACMELGLRDLPALEPLIEQLKQETASPAGWQIHWERGNKGWKTERINSLGAAVSMIDFASISGHDGAMAEVVTIPHICVGLGLCNARYTERKLEISLAGEDWLDVETGFRDLRELSGKQPMTIRFRHADQDCVRTEVRAIGVPQGIWQSLDVWTSNTLVPADENSRSDAGAGNTDND